MKNKIYFLILIALFFFANFSSVFAADISCVSDKLSVIENQTFTVNVNINTKGVYINNAEGVVSFPKDLLSAESVSVNGSIFSMWVEQPKLSNITGLVSFNGGIPTPGFNGAKGKVVSILFKAKKTGIAKISFSSANVYANDGMGTDITSNKNGVSIEIVSVKKVEKKEEKIVINKKTKTDTISPVDLEVIPSVTSEDLVSLGISSKDIGSGVGKYKISVDGVFVKVVNVDSGSVDVVLPPETSGNHEVSVIAYDKAGNLSEKVISVDFPEIKSPKIIKYPESIQNGEKIEIIGTSYANAEIKIWIQNEGSDPKNYIVKTEDDKKFIFVSDFINKSGTTSVWAEVVRSNNIISPPSSKYFVVVKKPKAVEDGIMIIKVLVGILSLLVVLISVSFYQFFKLKRMKRKLLIDLDQTSTEAHKVFIIINEDIKEVLKILKYKGIKERLTHKDEEIINVLENDIEDAEQYFNKRIKFIKKNDL